MKNMDENLSTEVAETPSIPPSLFQRAHAAQVHLANVGSRPVKAGVQTVATNIFQVFGVLALTAIIARTLGAEGKGGYDLFAASALLLQYSLGFSLASGVIYTVATGEVNTGLLLRAVVLFSAAEGVVAGTLIYICQRLGWGSYFVPPAVPWAALLLGLNVTVLGLSTTARAVLIGARRFLAANAGDIFKQLFGIAIAVATVLAAHRLHFSLLFALLIANVITITATSLVYLRLSKLGVTSKGTTSGFEKSFRFALPCFFASASQFLNYRMDLFFVNAFHGRKEVGVYMAAVLLAQAVNLIPSATQSVLFPTVAAADSHEASAIATARANRMLTALAVCGACALAAISPFVLPRAFGPQFKESVPLLLLLLPGCTAFATTNVLAGFFNGVGRPRFNLVASLCGLCATVALDFALVPRFAARGAAVASTLSYIVSTIVSVYLFKKFSGVPVSKLYLLSRHDVESVIATLKSRRAASSGSAA